MAAKRVDEGEVWFERVTEGWAASVAARLSLQAPATARAAGEALSLDGAVVYALALE